MASMHGVRSVDLAVTDLARSVEFYTKVWGLLPVAQTEKSAYLRGTSSHHHLLALHAGPRAELLRVTHAAADRKSVDAYYEQVRAAGAPEIEAPAAVDEIAGGYGFTFRDPEGRIMQVIADDKRHAALAPNLDRPVQITHVVLNSADYKKMADFYIRALGFRIIDEVAVMLFLNCSTDHHSIGMFNSTHNALNHIAFDMINIDAVMRGAGRMKENGYEMGWGVGRHSAANNVYAYFCGPDQEMIEFTTEVDQIGPDYVPKGPDYWSTVYPPGRRDHWGYNTMSESYQAAHGKLPFSPAKIFHDAPAAAKVAEAVS